LKEANKADDSMKRKCFFKNPRAGITLPELLIAFSILAMTLLPISGLIGFGHKGTSKDFRMVQAIELLIERMNQMNAVPFKQLNTLITTGTTVRLTNTIFPGTNLEVQLGPIDKNGINFNVSATLIKFPVTFTYRPINFSDLSYNVDRPETWRFDAERSDVYDGNTYPYKVLKVLVQVDWTEPIVNVGRSINALSFVVDLEE